MFLLPEFSYIAVPGFIPKMRGQRHKTSSLILHNTNDYKWDYFLRQGDSFLMSWLHNKTGFIHNIYFPYAPDNRFLDGNNQHIIDIIQPAITRIKNFLLRYEVEDVEEYMNDSEEWLSILFSFGPHHYKAAEIACSCFGIQIDEFPVKTLVLERSNTFGDRFPMVLLNAPYLLGIDR